MSLKRCLLGSLVLVMAATAQATTLSLSYEYTGAYSADGMWTSKGMVDYGQLQPETYWYVFDLYFQISDLEANELGFGNMELDVDMTNVSIAANYVRDSSKWQPPGPPGTPEEFVLPDNGDFGTVGDYKNIVSGINSGLTNTSWEPVTVGQGSPYKSGIIYLEWAGNVVGEAVINGKAFSINDVNGKLQEKTTGGVINDATIDFVPEPTTLALLGIGGLVALRRRRR